MTLEIRDALTLASIIIAAISMYLVNRNARRATSQAAENTDMARIRDLRAELKETETELGLMRGQVTDLNRRLTEANEAAMEAYRQRFEMLRYAKMPGVTIEEWILRFDPPRIDR